MIQVTHQLQVQHKVSSRRPLLAIALQDLVLLPLYLPPLLPFSLQPLLLINLRQLPNLPSSLLNLHHNPPQEHVSMLLVMF